MLWTSSSLTLVTPDKWEQTRLWKEFMELHTMLLQRFLMEHMMKSAISGALESYSICFLVGAHLSMEDLTFKFWTLSRRENTLFLEELGMKSQTWLKILLWRCWVMIQRREFQPMTPFNMTGSWKPSKRTQALARKRSMLPLTTSENSILVIESSKPHLALWFSTLWPRKRHKSLRMPSICLIKMAVVLFLKRSSSKVTGRSTETTTTSQRWTPSSTWPMRTTMESSATPSGSWPPWTDRRYWLTTSLKLLSRD